MKINISKNIMKKILSFIHTLSYNTANGRVYYLCSNSNKRDIKISKYEEKKIIELFDKFLKGTK